MIRKSFFHKIFFLFILLLCVNIVADSAPNRRRGKVRGRARYHRTVKAVTHGIDIDKQRYPVTGIDISQYTGEVDFDKLIKYSKRDLDFIYLRASLGVAAYGERAFDRRFNTYYKDATERGLHVGAYHFFKFQYGGTAQAKFFLQQIKGKKFDLPLVIDIEEYGNRGQWNPQTIVTNIRAFLQTVRKERDEDIIFYSNRNTFHKYIKPYFPDEKVWICSFINPSEATPPIKEWLFWQHSHKGRLTGAQNAVDLNTYNGTREEWENFIKQCIADRDQRAAERQEGKKSSLGPYFERQNIND